MDVSLSGWLGAFVGAFIGAISYAVVVGALEPRLRALDTSQTADERTAFERKLSLMRRLILGIEVTALAIVGYLLGRTIGG
jgi:hypothetical protein